MLRRKEPRRHGEEAGNEGPDRGVRRKVGDGALAARPRREGQVRTQGHGRGAARGKEGPRRAVRGRSPQASEVAARAGRGGERSRRKGAKAELEVAELLRVWWDQYEPGVIFRRGVT